MKQNYSFVLKTLLFVAMVFVSFSAKAGEEKTYWSYITAQAYPSAQGKVYVKTPEGDEPTEDAYQSYMEAKYTFTSNVYSYTTYTFYAQPVGDANFVGWTKINDNEAFANNDFIVNDELLSQDILSNDLVASFNSYPLVTTDGSEIGDSYPMEPDEHYVAVFGNIKFAYIPGQQNYLGTAKISKLSSQVGDEVTITAEPVENAEFEYWMDENGNKVTENPYTFTVTGPKTYTPRFRHIVYGGNFDCAETGELIIFNTPYVTFASDAYDAGCCEIYNITSESWQENKEYISNVPDAEGWSYQIHDNEGQIMLGKGTFTLQYDEDNTYTAKNEEDLCFGDPIGYDIAELPESGYKYYVLADDHKFHQVCEGFVDNERWALMVPDSVVENRITIDFVLEAAGETVEKRFPIKNPFNLADFKLVEATGIENVEADEPKTLQQIFDLGGRIVTTRQKGIVIKDGKKQYIK